MELGHNLRAAYAQRVKGLKIKPRTLILAFHENGQVVDELDNYNKGIRVVLPTTLKTPKVMMYTKYISLLTPKQKRNMFMTSSILSSSRTTIVDANFFMYRMHNMLFNGLDKLNKRYVAYSDYLFNDVFKPEIFRNFNYRFVAFNYILDISKRETKFSKVDLRKMFLGTLNILFNSKDYEIQAEQIIFTLKIKHGYVNFLVYIKGKQNFNINRILNIINSYIYTEKEEIAVNDKIIKTMDKFNVMLTNKVESKEVKDHTLNIIQNYIHNHPDEKIEVSMPFVNEAIVEELESSEIPVSEKNFNYLINKLQKMKPPSTTIENNDNDFNYIFNENKQIGSAFNFRKASFKDHLISQIREFDKYFMEQYDIKLKGISVKNVKTKSIYRDEMQMMVMTFKDSSNKEFKLDFLIPKELLNGDPYVNMEGAKRTLLLQLYQSPLMNVKPFETVFKTNYSAISFRSDIKSKHRGIFVYAQGKKIPYLSFIAIGKYMDIKDEKDPYVQFELLLKAAGINKSEYSVSDVLPKDTHRKYYIKIKDKYYILKEKSENRSKQIFWSMIAEYKEIRESTINSIQDLNKMFENKYTASYLNSIRQQNKYMVDPTVKFLLSDPNADVFKIYNEAVDMCMSGSVSTQTDLNNRRIRASESVAVAIFKKVNPALNNYHKTKGAVQPKIKSDALMQDLLTGSLQTQFQTVQNQNPLSEIAYMSKVTYSGLNGVTPENAPTSLRTVHDSFFGVIDPIDTPDSKAVGVTRHLSVNAEIDKMNGAMKMNSTNNHDINPLSIISNYSPFPAHNDGNRLQFASSQMKSVVSMKNAELPYSMSSYSNVPINMVSESFAKKSPIAGDVTNVTDDTITIKVKNIETVIKLNKYSFNTSNTIATIKPIVKIGDKIEEGQVIAAAEEFFEFNNLKIGLNGYTVIKPHNVANFEDAIIISESFAKRNTSVHGYIQSSMLNEGDNIYEIKPINSQVTRGDNLIIKGSEELLESNTINNNDNYNILLESDELDSDGDFDSQIDMSSEYDDNSDDTVEDDSENIYTDSFNKKLKSKATGVIVDIEIYAKSEDILKKYPELYRIHNEKIQILENNIKKLTEEVKRIDLTDLEKELANAKDIYGKTYKGKPIEYILILFKIKADKVLEIGDKLHNRHGENVAA